MFTPVFPPTAASTIANKVVGICTTPTPRSQVAATNPARSVTVPPPKPIIMSVLENSDFPRIPQQKAATSILLESSPSGTPAKTDSNPLSARKSLSVSALTDKPTGWMMRTFFAPDR